MSKVVFYVIVLRTKTRPTHWSHVKCLVADLVFTSITQFQLNLKILPISLTDINILKKSKTTLMKLIHLHLHVF